MRSLLLIFVLLSTLAADVCRAQANSVNILCSACRDPHDYPNDFANFAFNQIYGPDAWLDFDLADDFYVTNLSNQRVYVDVDYVFLGFGFEGFRVPYWPTYILKITLALPNGNLLSVYRSVFQTSLPVPSSNESDQDDAGAGSSSSGGGDGGGDEDDEDYGDFDADYEWDDIEFDEYEGSTWIEDPDENGDFQDPDWCEEC